MRINELPVGATPIVACIICAHSGPDAHDCHEGADCHEASREERLSGVWEERLSGERMSAERRSRKSSLLTPMDSREGGLPAPWCRPDCQDASRDGMEDGGVCHEASRENGLADCHEASLDPACVAKSSVMPHLASRDCQDASRDAADSEAAMASRWARCSREWL